MTAIWRLGDTGERKYLYIAGALGGSALAVKFGALAFMVVAIPFAVLEARRSRKAAGAIAIAFFLFLAAALPPYATAYFKTGNPVFPFLYRRFPSPLLARNANVLDLRFREPLAWSVPFAMTFRSNGWYEGQSGTFGYQYLLFAPLALAAALLVRRRPAVSAAAVALGASYLVLRTEPNARYLYAALPLVTIPVAALAGWMAQRNRALCGALLAFAAISAAVNIYFIPGSSYYHKDFYIEPFLSRERREQYLEYTAPIRGVIAHFNRAHAGEAVLLTGDSAIAGIQGDVYENDWHQFSTLDRIRRTLTAPEMLGLMREWKVRNFILRKPGPGATIRPTALRDLIVYCTTPEFENSRYYAARLLDRCEATHDGVTPLAASLPGTYDDAGPTVELMGHWARSDAFDGPWDHTVSYSNVAGSEASFTFDGRAVTYVFTKAPNRGLARVFIDGVDRGEVDLYSPRIEWQSRVRFPCQAAGRHVVRIRVTEEKAAAASEAYVDVDAFVVE
jgi:hypothetical protein